MLSDDVQRPHQRLDGRHSLGKVFRYRVAHLAVSLRRRRLHTHELAHVPTARGEDVRKLMRVETAAAEADGEMRNAIPEDLAKAVPPVEPLVRSLHVVGKQDAMNPPAQAMRVAEAFFCPELLEHPGGHVVPMDERAMKAYANTMR